MVSFDGINRVLNPIVLHLKRMELELNCPICLKLMDQPMLLPCDHMLCNHCIRPSTDDGLSCPFCRCSFVPKDLRSATHVERLLSIYKNMNSAIEGLQQVSSGIPDSSIPFSRTPISSENHTRRMHTHATENEAFIDQMDLSSPCDNGRDSNSDSLDRVDGNIIQTCAFCHSFRTTQASGEMLHYLNGELIPEDKSSQPDVLHVHRSCFEWAPQVYFSGETVMNLEAELSRSSKIKCGSCGLKGAALGCYVQSCRKSFHVPCAYEILECRWDCENFLLLCPVHASRKLPCDRSNSKKSKTNSGTEAEDEAWKSSFCSGRDLVICGSDLSKEDKLLLDKFAKLSGLTVTYQWEQNVTHVIAATNEDGACIRTMKFLMAILNGIWVLSMGWIIACLESGHPVPENNYEITHDVHGCFDGPKNGRIQATQRVASKLFNALAFHFIGFFEPSYKSKLEGLVIAAGGKVLNKSDLLKLSNSPSDSQTEKSFIVYCVDSVVARLEDPDELAVKAGAVLVRHTLFLNAIAAYDLHILTA
ncbi:Protein breast cancer susceptibility 1-like [Apostasia shenzhenica]|uniref:Protein breast cancer susceptibility 1-like n=1 Tax=Apostasia shenzhenica TaxID=1088818 RepID=A0A2I0A970_9ASPA|nr:Protein breast cancer susceptibility 1-like [Apostasia shenzhenica]